MPRYVALLRGINVGGNNLIPMPALKKCFEDAGFSSVATYIQSGNVVFDSKETSRAKLARRIEQLLSATFKRYAASVVVRSRTQVRDIVKGAPEGFGDEPTKYRYDVLFLKEPLTARSALAIVPVAKGVDEVSAGRGVLYYSRLVAKATRSKLGRVVGMPIYKQMTIRNWNTTTALLRLME